MTYPKAKRGDVVAIQVTTAKLKKKAVTYYYLGKVTGTSEGRVTAYRKANGAQGDVDIFHWVYVISDPEAQAAARDLFAESDLDFEDLDAIKKAICQK